MMFAGVFVVVAGPQASAAIQRFQTRQLAARLTTPVSATWQGQTIGNALERLSELYKIDVWLDRRVDIRATVELSIRNKPLVEALDGLADQLELAVVPFGDIAYVGPSATAQELRTLAAIARQSVARMPSASRQRWLHRTNLEFEHLSEPRQLVEDIVESAGADVVNPTAIPHDLWRETKSAATPTIDALVLLLFGFDLTCHLSPDGREVRVKLIRRPVHLAYDYQLSPRQLQEFESILHEWPEARRESANQGVRLFAGWDTHFQVQQEIGLVQPDRPLANRPPTPRRDSDAQSGERAFTLRLREQPLGAVLDQLSAQLGFAVAWSNELDPTQVRQRRVSCNVREVGRDELLKAVVSSADLDCEFSQGEIRIVPPR